MFGLFKKKIKAKDIIISNIGFHRVFNYCRDTFDHRLHDDYSHTTHKKIIKNLLELAKNNEPAFLTLKIVEIIGEDEPYQLDSETIYFITYLLNQINLKKIRNDILLSALPLRS